jgi:hypothetical protein
MDDLPVALTLGLSVSAVGGLVHGVEAPAAAGAVVLTPVEHLVL